MTSVFLLDTNVPSELTNASPDPRVKAWIGEHDNLHLSVISIGELRRGITLLAEGKRRTQLEQWFDRSLLPLFADNILPITQAIADRWGVLGAECQRRGTPMNLADGLIAATALEHGLTVVTRNVKDFAYLGVSIRNPWMEAGAPPSAQSHRA